MVVVSDAGPLIALSLFSTPPQQVGASKGGRHNLLWSFAEIGLPKRLSVENRLSKLGQLALLPALYDQILIPQAVYDEVVVGGLREGHADAIAVDHFVRLGRIVVRPIQLSANDRDWASRIDRGEAEVIALARDIGADWAIIDNIHARRAARSQGVSLRGTIGVLLEATSKGLLTILELELLIEEIKRRPEFWIGEQLCDAALEQVRTGRRSITGEE